MRDNSGPRVRSAWSAVVLGLLLAMLAASGATAQTPTPPTGWPLPGPAPVLHPFDPPVNPWGAGHRGVDLRATVGEDVLATGPGRVTFAGTLAGRGVIVVDHGSLRTTYEPVAASVAVGTRVSTGTVLGHLTRGTHCGGVACLHWGLRQGNTYLDPLGTSTDAGSATTAPVRLLPASARALAERRAAVRTAARLAAQAAAMAAGFLPNLPSTSGRHGFLHPVFGPITSGFGRRYHPILHVWKLHDGTDFGANCGTPIRAPYPGVVTRTVNSPAYGHRLFLDHGRVDGRHVLTSYNHAERYVVGAGTRVTRGQVIGYVGATGYATGCHLHLMVWLDGRLTNPVTWF